MKVGIVSKLFLLTTLLCALVIATIYIGQTVFFKQYYTNEKVKDIQTAIQSFKKDTFQAWEDALATQKLEQDFYQARATWITTLDRLGNLRNANDFSVRVHITASSDDEKFIDRILTVPLYHFARVDDLERIAFHLEPGKHVSIDAAMKDGVVIPVILTAENRHFVLENQRLSEKLYGNKAGTTSPTESLSTIYLTGEIVALQLPEGTQGSRLYANRVWIERMKAFQANVLFDERRQVEASALDYEENHIHYKLFVEPITDPTGETAYIFAMTSLQPVDEAVQMLKGYYVYLMMFALALAVLASFYYSKKIAKPLLRINETTNKMARLDFSETIPIASQDEIGALSQNINTLSHTLHKHIQQLRREIEKEKQLEKTRKEFISGVSHELKTPLSVMKSCVSILADDIAPHKKERYFQAMANEIDKMDMLIVDMLELATFESGTYQMKMEVFEIDQLIETVCEQLAIDWTNKRLHVEKRLSKTKVVGNPRRIEQVLNNFLSNAIRHTPENKKIAISTIEENDRVNVCVENEGEPIAEDHLDKIWDRFYRGETSRNRSQGGTGLGLAISKNILELHDARYGARNTEHGVMFFFDLTKEN